jgi:hypothetical protein
MSLVEIDEFVDLLWLETEVVPGMFEIEKIELDSTDDKFIAAAFEGRGTTSLLKTLYIYCQLRNLV